MENKLTIRFSGPQGAGVQSVADVCANYFLREGYNVFATSDFESRIIGGYSFSQIAVSVNEINSVNESPDICFSFTPESLMNDLENCNENTKFFSDKGGGEFENVTDIPVEHILGKEGSFAINIFYLGLLTGITSSNNAQLKTMLKEYFSGKDEKMILKNLDIAGKGYEYALNKLSYRIKLGTPQKAVKPILKNGSEAVTYGAIASGLKFFSAYPMSPSTSVMTGLSARSKEFGIFVEQAEDEIAAINLVLGASYAGVRAMTATSGGGLALMSETISLAAVSETPVVIVNAQRPGPATGLPTKTGQADLSMVLSIGHGEFTRVILTPGTTKKAFESTQKAFYIAEKYQVPVFILTDQYFMDSLMISREWDLIEEYKERFIDHSTGEASKPALYPRYPISIKGALSRRIPGGSSSLILSDSHIHDEYGLISEDCEVSEKLTKKLLDKESLLLIDIEEPEILFPDSNYMMIGWGSTYGVIRDVCKELNREGISIGQMHFHEIYPLNKEFISRVINSSEKTFCIENNATGQLSSLLMRDCSVQIDEKVLKFDGRPFYFDELKKEISGRIK